MAHKKFIDNPLGVRLSKKESLLIPLQEPKAGVPASFPCDLCVSWGGGYTGKGPASPLHLCAPVDLGAVLSTWLLELPSWLVWRSLSKPVWHWPWISNFSLDCSGVSITVQRPGSARPANREKRKKIYLFFFSCFVLYFKNKNGSDHLTQ